MEKNLEKIKKAGILWFSKIFMMNRNGLQIKCLDVSVTTIYRYLRTNYFLAFPEEEMRFMGKAYDKIANFADFQKLLDTAILFEGELDNIKDPKIAMIHNEINFKNFLQFLKTEKPRKVYTTKMKNPLKITREILEEVSDCNNCFRMTYFCKHCNLPEDECCFVWILKDDKGFSIPVWIHNEGNMWIAHFNEYRVNN